MTFGFSSLVLIYWKAEVACFCLSKLTSGTICSWAVACIIPGQAMPIYIYQKLVPNVCVAWRIWFKKLFLVGFAFKGSPRLP